ncbi:MAG: polysaccharide pyruvyl transferase family protein [Clostridia bacterium]|nr:polysaccharide pyruvyl transferase family protein [Clostridia bacterium]
MKTGILTFHYAINYGAVLQMYGLKKKLESLGHDVEIINYVPSDFDRDSLRSTLRVSGIKKKTDIKNSLKRIYINLKNQKNLFKSFDGFLDEYFKLSDPANDFEWKSVVENYDYVFVGSDQVWNPSNRKSDIYFLNTGSDKPAKISYAADSTNDKVQSETVGNLASALSQFRGISVRNAHSCRFVEKITGKSPEIVPDPVILCDFSEFCKPLSGEKYALVYILGKEIKGGHDAVISLIKEKYVNLKIIQVVMMKQKEFMILDSADKKIYSCTPDEWVNLIYNAEFVYTDSFHCILFSMKFHKNFLSYYADELRAPRLIALREQYGLGSKIVSSAEEAKECKSIDFELNYDAIDSIFEDQKKIGTNFIIKHTEAIK